MSRYAFASVCAFAVVGYAQGQGDLNTMEQFRLWATGCAHVHTDLRVGDRESLIEAIRRFEADGVAWSPRRIQQHAQQFNTARFRERFQRFLAWSLEQYDLGGTARLRAAMRHVERDAFL